MSPTRYFAILLAAGLLGSCQHTDPAPTPAPAPAPPAPTPVMRANFSHSGTAQNFTPLQFANAVPDATSYEWSFGDGTRATVANPAHTFRRAGTYQVRLRVTGPRGTADTTKTLTLAQADTAGIIVARTVGRYHFGKGTLSVPQGLNVPPIVYRLRDTTLAIVGTGNQALSIGGRTLRLRSSTAPWPVTTNPTANYLFEDMPVPSNYVQIHLSQTSDSLIYTLRLGGVGSPTITTYYGRRLP